MMLSRWLLFLAIYAVGIAASYGLSLAGEPQSYWLWCTVFGVC